MALFKSLSRVANYSNLKWSVLPLIRLDLGCISLWCSRWSLPCTRYGILTIKIGQEDLWRRLSVFFCCFRRIYRKIWAVYLSNMPSSILCIPAWVSSVWLFLRTLPLSRSRTSCARAILAQLGSSGHTCSGRPVSRRFLRACCPWKSCDGRLVWYSGGTI